VNETRRLVACLRPYRTRLAAALLCTLGYGAAGGLGLGLIGPFAQVLFSGAAPEPLGGAPVSLPAMKLPPFLAAWLVPWLSAVPPAVALQRVTLALFLAFLVKNVFDYLQRYLMVFIEQAVVRDLRNQLDAQVHRLSLSYFHERRVGQITSRLIHDVELVRGALAAGLSNFVKYGLFLAICLAWLFWASWQLAVVSLLLVPPVAFVVVRVGREIHRRSERLQEQMGELQAVLAESLASMRVVKAFAAEAFEVERFQRENSRYYRAFVRLRRVGALAGPLAEMAMVTLAAGVLTYAGFLLFEARTIDAASFFLFLVAFLSTISPVKNLSNVNSTIQEGLAAAARTFRLLDETPEVRSRAGAPRAEGLGDRLALEGVSFRYGDGPLVLREVDLVVQRGERLALVGPSGAGKSTLVDLLPRFYDPTGGVVRLDGRDLRDLELTSLRRLFGLVPQDPVLFRDTVARNVAYGEAEPDRERVERAARAANAHDFVARLARGYDTVLGERGLTLSGGERQRLALARAVYRDPPILILDEATSQLDSESERLIEEALQRLLAGRTVIVIAHRLATVRRADRIVVLEGGRIGEIGSHEALLSASDTYQRLHALQFGS
jgi:subfamily B ATP-binding cassette protein MsbA